jgi:hypothetical protein
MRERLKRVENTVIQCGSLVTSSNDRLTTMLDPFADIFIIRPIDNWLHAMGEGTRAEILLPKIKKMCYNVIQMKFIKKNCGRDPRYRSIQFRTAQHDVTIYNYM